MQGSCQAGSSEAHEPSTLWAPDTGGGEIPAAGRGALPGTNPSAMAVPGKSSPAPAAGAAEPLTAAARVRIIRRPGSTAAVSAGAAGAPVASSGIPSTLAAEVGVGASATAAPAARVRIIRRPGAAAGTAATGEGSVAEAGSLSTEAEVGDGELASGAARVGDGVPSGSQGFPGPLDFSSKEGMREQFMCPITQVGLDEYRLESRCPNLVFFRNCVSPSFKFPRSCVGPSFNFTGNTVARVQPVVLVN